MKAKKPKIIGGRWKMPDGTSVELTLVESEEARLWEMHRLLSYENPELRQRGEMRLKQLAERLAKERAQAVAQKRDSDLGAEKRREVGRRKAQIIETAKRKGLDPLTLVSERQLRRIKKRPN